jgi:hypothetical protein
LKYQQAIRAAPRARRQPQRGWLFAKLRGFSSSALELGELSRWVERLCPMTTQARLSGTRTLFECNDHSTNAVRG